MGHYYNPIISSPDTLVLNIDAANSRSYPGTGNTCYDLSLRNNRGTLSSVTFAGSGGTGTFVFDGLTSSINLGTVSGGNQTTSWTIESWIKPNSAGEGSSGRIFQHSSGSLTGYICALDNSAVSNGIKLNTYAVGGFTVRIGNCITNGVWQQVVWAFSPGLVTYYVNGTAIGSSSTTSPASYTGNDYIGNDPGGTSTFDGSIGVVRLYGNTLTALEIRKNYNSLKARYGL